MRLATRLTIGICLWLCRNRDGALVGRGHTLRSGHCRSPGYEGKGGKVLVAEIHAFGAAARLLVFSGDPQDLVMQRYAGSVSRGC